MKCFQILALCIPLNLFCMDAPQKSPELVSQPPKNPRARTSVKHIDFGGPEKVINKNADVVRSEDELKAECDKAEVLKTIRSMLIKKDTGLDGYVSQKTKVLNNPLGESLLSIALHFPTPSKTLIQFLVPKYSDPNERFKTGETPVVLALAHAWYSIARYLVSQGASVTTEVPLYQSKTVTAIAFAKTLYVKDKEGKYPTELKKFFKVVDKQYKTHHVKELPKDTD